MSSVCGLSIILSLIRIITYLFKVESVHRSPSPYKNKWIMTSLSLDFLQFGWIDFLINWMCGAFVLIWYSDFSDDYFTLPFFPLRLHEKNDFKMVFRVVLMMVTWGTRSTVLEQLSPCEERRVERRTHIQVSQEQNLFQMVLNLQTMLGGGGQPLHVPTIRNFKGAWEFRRQSVFSTETEPKTRQTMWANLILCHCSFFKGLFHLFLFLLYFTGHCPDY